MKFGATATLLLPARRTYREPQAGPNGQPRRRLQPQRPHAVPPGFLNTLDKTMADTLSEVIQAKSLVSEP